MEGRIESICDKHKLKVVEEFNLGNICKTIYKVQDENDKMLVLKVGLDANSIAEVRMNSRGYSNIEKIGLKSFIPKIIICEITENMAYVIMEYCGDDFFTQSKKSDNPIFLYNYLVVQLGKIYKESLREGVDGQKMILFVINKVRQQYEKYIYHELDKDREIASKLDDLERMLDVSSLHYTCFSNWDFTPEDVYLTSGGVKYSDPHEDVLGIPVVDLACFAGVARDAHHLHGSQEGYELLKRFAIEEVSKILFISKQTARKIFYLGIFLQSLLSTRFRLNSEPETARKIFLNSKKYLQYML